MKVARLRVLGAPGVDGGVRAAAAVLANPRTDRRRHGRGSRPTPRSRPRRAPSRRSGHSAHQPAATTARSDASLGYRSRSTASSMTSSLHFGSSSAHRGQPLDVAAPELAGATAGLWAQAPGCSGAQRVRWRCERAPRSRRAPVRRRSPRRAGRGAGAGPPSARGALPHDRRAARARAADRAAAGVRLRRRRGLGRGHRRRNRAAFERVTLHPRAFVDVSEVEIATTVLGRARSRCR